jgi:hypothetical protein
VTEVIAVEPRPEEPAGTAERRPSRTCLRVGLGAAAATVAFLLPGAGRSYDLDSGLTVAHFVATPSIGDAFTRTFLFTNQVFFSFLDHLVYSATGSKSEVVMRLLPIAFSAAAVGLLALLAAPFGRVPALAGAAVLASNPMFAFNGSQVRGYSLVVLCAIAATSILLRCLSTPKLSTGTRIAYAVAGAVGVATHLYMLVVLAIHAVIGLRSPRRAAQLVVPWVTALLGLSAYIAIAHNMRIVTKVNGRVFQPPFPRDLAIEILGGGVAAAVVLLAVALPAAWRARRDPVLQLGAAATIGAVVAAWLIAPGYLYPRFFVWLVPIPAIAAAAMVARRHLAIVLVLVVVVLQVHTVWPRLTADLYPNREAGRIFDEVTARHGRACVLNPFAALRLEAYTPSAKGIFQPSQLDPCTVAFAINTPPRALVQLLDKKFPYRAKLHAHTDGYLWSTVPTDCWTSNRPRAGCELPPR